MVNIVFLSTILQLGFRAVLVVLFSPLLINSMLLLSIQPKLSLQYKIINSANIKKTKPISILTSFFRYWLSFFILAEFMIL